MLLDLSKMGPPSHVPQQLMLENTATRITGCPTKLSLSKRIVSSDSVGAAHNDVVNATPSRKAICGSGNFNCKAKRIGGLVVLGKKVGERVASKIFKTSRIA